MSEIAVRSEKNLVDRVYRSTRALILDGTYGPDEPLRLVALADQNQVSFIPVREALRMLEVERLIIAEPNKGDRVAPLSMKSLEDLYLVRKVLESEAVRLAARRVDPEFIGQLRSLIGQAVSAIEAGEMESGLALHRKFHFALYELSGSEWLCNIIENLWGHSARYVKLASVQARFVCSIDDNHHAIIDCLERGDAEGAAMAMNADLGDTIELLREELAVEVFEVRSGTTSSMSMPDGEMPCSTDGD